MTFESRHTPASDTEAQALGCTCEWCGTGYIAEFNPTCPILTRHIGYEKILPRPLWHDDSLPTEAEHP
jgi:hypothetical protein